MRWHREQLDRRLEEIENNPDIAMPGPGKELSRFLMTWNLRHIANAQMRFRIERACLDAGYAPPVICTPEELLETP